MRLADYDERGTTVVDVLGWAVLLVSPMSVVVAWLVGRRQGRDRERLHSRRAMDTAFDSLTDGSPNGRDRLITCVFLRARWHRNLENPELLQGRTK